MEELLAIGSQSLRKAALNEDVKAYILQNESLFNVLKELRIDTSVVKIYLKQSIKLPKENSMGFKCSIEFMGESTRTVKEALEAKDEFVNICQTIHNQNLNSTVSLDLSHIGLAISEDLCFENISVICKAAGDKEVIISAEGTERTDAILELYKKLPKIFLTCR